MVAVMKIRGYLGVSGSVARALEIGVLVAVLQGQ